MKLDMYIRAKIDAILKNGAITTCRMLPLFPNSVNFYQPNKLSIYWKGINK